MLCSRPGCWRPLAMVVALAGCSTAALDDPINFAVACRTDIALKMAQKSAGTGGVLDRALGQVAELAILKDAGRMKTYQRERDAMLAKNETMTEAQVNEAIDTKVTEMRAARVKATGDATC